MNKAQDCASKKYDPTWTDVIFDIDKTRVDSLKENFVLLHLAFISVAPTIGSISFVNIVITELVA